MLGRIANVILGCILSGLGSYMLFLHLTSGEPLRSFILLMGGASLAAGIACFWIALRREHWR